jgi:hypothetical protein
VVFADVLTDLRHDLVVATGASQEPALTRHLACLGMLPLLWSDAALP